MQNPDSQTIKELEDKRHETLKESVGWVAAFYATLVASIAALTVKDWRDAEGSWKKMLSLKSPARLFKTKTSSAATISALGIGAATGGIAVAKADKSAAYSDAIHSIKSHTASDTRAKNWADCETEKSEKSAAPNGVTL